jgi:fibro-slime domain-containing protein
MHSPADVAKGRTVDTSTPTDTSTGDTGDCEDVYIGHFYNLPADHPDIEGEVTGVLEGDLPANHDWWDETWWAFDEEHPGLEFGDDWWPVDEGLEGDPQYFAVHWEAQLEVDTDSVVAFELGSDDDGWAFIDDILVADLGGIHGVEATSFVVSLTAGVHSLDLYMAERHTSNSGFWFRWMSDEVRIWTCPS